MENGKTTIIMAEIDKPVCDPVVSCVTGQDSCWDKVSPSLQYPCKERRNKLECSLVLLQGFIWTSDWTSTCFLPYLSNGGCVDGTKLQLLFLLQPKTSSVNSLLLICDINTSCFIYLISLRVGKLTSSLLISLINSRTSFMAPGVGANTENVSSSTWFIVAPPKDKTNR